MSDTIVTIIAAGIGLAVLLWPIIVDKRPLNYNLLFWVGLIWIVAGIAIENIPFAIVGVFCDIVGLANLRRWKR